MKYLFLVIIPILFLVPGIDSSADHSLELIYKDDKETKCREGQVLIYHYNKADYLCTSEKNSQLWINLGMAEKVASNEAVDESNENILFNEMSDRTEAFQEINDIRAKSYVVRFHNGDFEKTYSFETFSRFEAGKDNTFLTIFGNEGFSNYFLLESLPSKDKVELYNLLIARYINPGKSPENFDVSIDTVSGNGDVILTSNNKNCKVTEYTPYVQNWLAFYQFSIKISPEIREHIVIFCTGFQVQVFDDEQRKRAYQPGVVPNPLPKENDHVTDVVVHFFDGEFKQVYTIHTFSKFAPTKDTADTPYATFTTPEYEFGSTPQFYLESLPSVEKSEFYKFLARYINPGKTPELFNVSIDLITGDGTILQRWNYVKCDATDYQMYVAETLLNFPFSNPDVLNIQKKTDLFLPFEQEEVGREIRDKVDFRCAGVNLELFDGVNELPKVPIADVNYVLRNAFPENVIGNVIPTKDERAMSFKIKFMGGDFTQTYTSDSIEKFQGISRERGPLTPANSAKQYDYGFLIETLPTTQKSDAYNFFARYINPGKTPEPFDVQADIVTGNGTLIETVSYTKCNAIDFEWYLQDVVFVYQFSGKPQSEIREKYIFYCTGLRILVP